MNITFDELRRVKHSLPTGSVKRIADKLGITEQTVRNFFGAKKAQDGELAGWHLEPGPNGGIVNIHDTSIYEEALRIIEETKATMA